MARRRKFKARPAKFEVWKDDFGGHRWNVIAMNGRNLGNGGEAYLRASDCRAGAVACAVAILRKLAPELLAENAPPMVTFDQAPANGQPITIVGMSDFSGRAGSVR